MKGCISLKECPPGPVHVYAVAVYGYGEARYTAASPSKARAQAYRDFCDAITGWDFHKFLVMSRVRRVNDPTEILQSCGRRP